MPTDIFLDLDDLYAWGLHFFRTRPEQAIELMEAYDLDGPTVFVDTIADWNHGCSTGVMAEFLQRHGIIEDFGPDNCWPEWCIIDGEKQDTEFLHEDFERFLSDQMDKINAHIEKRGFEGHFWSGNLGDGAQGEDLYLTISKELFDVIQSGVDVRKRGGD